MLHLSFHWTTSYELHVKSEGSTSLVLLSSKGDRKSGRGLMIYVFLLSILPFCEVSENNEVMKYLGSRM